jgi:hypothetical protein
MSEYNITVVPNIIGQEHNLDYALAAQVVTDNLRYRMPEIKVSGVDIREANKLPEDSDMIMITGVYSGWFDVMKEKIHNWLKNGKKVVMGGIGLIHAPELVMESISKDISNSLKQNLIGFRGEAESEFLHEFVQAIINEDDLSETPGAVYWDSYKVKENGLVLADISELSRVPVSYSDFYLTDSIRLETSKGCYSRCSFCNANYTKSKPRRLKSYDYVGRSLENALNRINELYPRLTLDIQLEIPDLDFIGPSKEQKRTVKVLETIDEIFSKYDFVRKGSIINYQAKTWKFSPHLQSKITDMMENGYRFLASVGFESMSADILKLWRKGSTPELNKEVLRKYIELGFHITAEGDTLKKSVITPNIIFTDFRMIESNLLEHINGFCDLMDLYSDQNKLHSLGNLVTPIYAEPRPNTPLESELKEAGLIYEDGSVEYSDPVVGVFVDFLWGSLNLKTSIEMLRPLLLQIYEFSREIVANQSLEDSNSFVKKIENAVGKLKVSSNEDLKLMVRAID